MSLYLVVAIMVSQISLPSCSYPRLLLRLPLPSGSYPGIVLRFSLSNGSNRGSHLDFPHLVVAFLAFRLDFL